MAVTYSNFFGGSFFGGGFFGAGVSTGSGGQAHSYGERRRTPHDIRDAREKFGIIEPKAKAIIEAVAERQAQSLDQDEHKHFEELSRELELQKIQWDTKYLDALNNYRDNLISQEIGRMLRQKIANEQTTALLLMAAGI